MPSGRVSLCVATAASCHTVSPPRAKTLVPAVRSCHGSMRASHVFLAFLPQIPGLGVFLKGEAGAWHEHPLQPERSQCRRCRRAPEVEGHWWGRPRTLLFTQSEAFTESHVHWEAQGCWGCPAALSPAPWDRAPLAITPVRDVSRGVGRSHQKLSMGLPAAPSLPGGGTSQPHSSQGGCSSQDGAADPRHRRSRGSVLACPSARVPVPRPARVTRAPAISSISS